MMLQKRINERLKALGLSATAASVEAGLSKDAIRNILRGTSESPRDITLRKLAKVLQCTPDYLTGQSNQVLKDMAPDDRNAIAQALEDAMAERGIKLGAGDKAALIARFLEKLA